MIKKSKFKGKVSGTQDSAVFCYIMISVQFLDNIIAFHCNSSKFIFIIIYRNMHILFL